LSAADLVQLPEVNLRLQAQEEVTNNASRPGINDADTATALVCRAEQVSGRGPLSAHASSRSSVRGTG
jgi:hypothetical protein